jgi:hypothetical protein
LKALIQSKREAAAKDALAKAQEGVGVLRELGIDDDTILKGLGFRGRSTAKTPEAAKANDGTTSSEDRPCPICNFRTDPPHNGRSHRGQLTKKPFTAEELEEKGLAKIGS